VKLLLATCAQSDHCHLFFVHYCMYICLLVLLKQTSNHTDSVDLLLFWGLSGEKKLTGVFKRFGCCRSTYE